MANRLKVTVFSDLTGLAVGGGGGEDGEAGGSIGPT